MVKFRRDGACLPCSNGFARRKKCSRLASNSGLVRTATRAPSQMPRTGRAREIGIRLALAASDPAAARLSRSRRARERRFPAMSTAVECRSIPCRIPFVEFDERWAHWAQPIQQQRSRAQIEKARCFRTVRKLSRGTPRSRRRPDWHQRAMPSISSRQRVERRDHRIRPQFTGSATLSRSHPRQISASKTASSPE